MNIATQAVSQALYNRTYNTAVGAMRIARGLKPGVENDFESFTNDSLVAAFATVADSVRAGAFVISSIALVAAGVGIMNIMLVSVTERTKEIGVRKSIGAKKRDILRQFLVEAVFLSELGGLVGILLGVAGGRRAGVVAEGGRGVPVGLGRGGLVGLLGHRDRLRHVSGVAGGGARPDRGVAFRVNRRLPSASGCATSLSVRLGHPCPMPFAPVQSKARGTPILPGSRMPQRF